MATAFDEYLESKVMTATPHQLHLMVVDGALRHATAAELALERRDFGKAETELGLAGECVAEMVAGLDASRMPELVESLRALFLFVHRNLAAAEARRQPNRVSDALRILRIHRQTWLALAERLKQDSPVQPVAAAGGFCWES